MKKREKSWKICSFCKYIKACDVGRRRILDLPCGNLHAINEIGCFDFEIYLSGHKKYKQLGFFRD